MRVERSKRLVHQDRFGLVGEAADELRPLAHPARDLVRVVGLELVQTNRLHEVSRASNALGLGDSPDGHADLDVREERGPRQECVALEDIPQARRGPAT